jgi:hypothetical protein
MSVFGVGPKIAFNVLALGEEADFEALSCHLIRSTKLHLSTEPAFFAKFLL